MTDTPKRIYVTLPESTVTLLDSKISKSDRSAFIDGAIRAHIHDVKKRSFRVGLEEAAITRRERDANLADEWFGLEEELCPS